MPVASPSHVRLAITALAALAVSAAWAAPRGTAASPEPAAAKAATRSGTVPPQPLKTVQLVYPEIADTNWSDGEVKLGLVVDETGKIGRIEVLQGAHPAFVDASLDALLATPYRAGSRDGIAVAMRVTRDYRFTLRNGGIGTVLNLGKPGGGAGGARLEVAPAVQLAAWPVYPSALLRSGTSGSAKVRVRIGAGGQASALELLEASHPDFGQATLAMLAAWRFDPAAAATPRGDLVWEQTFNAAKPAEAGVPASATRLMDRLALGGADIAGAGQLDGPLRPVLRVEAAVPQALRGARSDAQAVVNFYVDETGRVLLPELVSTPDNASDSAFGWAALTAVNRWRFEPPRRQGQPTTARGQVTLTAGPAQPQ